MDHSVQIIVGLSVLASTVALMGIFWWVCSRTYPQVEYSAITPGGYRLRGRYFWILLVVSIILGGIGISIFPYPSIMEGKVGGVPFVVKVVGSQFMWEMSETEIPVGPVRFDVTSIDVNHGFGVYDKDGWLVTQVQSMPDYINRLYVNFDKPGTYEVWCLEYCGLAHHIMVSEFEVK